MVWLGKVGRILRVQLLVACHVLSGCSLLDEPASQTVNPTFPVMISVHGGSRQPVAGAEILSQKRVLGTTDASGRVTLKLKGSEGSNASLDVKCPATFKSPEQPIVVGLRQMSSKSPAPQFEAECIPLVRKIVVGLRAENGGNLNVVRLNEVVGRTDEHGVAHLLLSASPGEQVTLTLNTMLSPNLRPQNPTLTFVAADRDEMVLLEQKFSVVKPVVKVKPKNIPKPL